MNGPQIHPMAGQEGYGIVINGNFASVTLFATSGEELYSAEVAAFATDAGAQSRTFRNLDEAAEWAIAAARTHEAQPNPSSGIVHWENRHGYALTVSRTEAGGYESGIFPMRQNDGQPVLNDPQEFPTQEEALEYARERADQYQKSEERRLRLVRKIGDALYLRTREPATGNE